MKKQVIITIILLIATVYVSVVYFKNLNPPGTRTTRVMHLIPNDAALIFEFNNDKGFYDIFNDNKLFKAVVGYERIGELDTLRQQLLQNTLLNKYFNGQNIFISLHPSKTNGFELLITAIAANDFSGELLEQDAKKPGSGLVITPIREGKKQGFNIYINALKKRFYIVGKENNIFLGSFSKELTDRTADDKNTTEKEPFMLLPEQQSVNSLASIYINYNQLSLLFEQLLRNKNSDIFKAFKLLPALGALSLNYRSDALMFNGATAMLRRTDNDYLNIFARQKPVINHLKDIFPATTAYSTSLSVSDAQQFQTDLTAWQNTNGLKTIRDETFHKLYAETGVNLRSEFDKLLGSEFAVVNTRFLEKIGIVAIKDGSKLRSVLSAVSTMNDEDTGQLNYDKLPLYLLGDVFSEFKKPYFTIIDNYLILANSLTELSSYDDTYLNRKFLSKNDRYNQFNDLLSAQSNVTFFFHLKNMQQAFGRDMKTDAYKAFRTDTTGWTNFYAATLQLSAADRNFYTNFCLRLNTETAAKK